MDIISDKDILKFGRGLTLLYVEDNEEARESTLGLLENFFDNIVVAVDGLDGVKKFNSSIDLIITDINMPKKNGIDMLIDIKEIDENIPSIVISAYTDSEYFTKTIEIGVDGYILKPLNNKNFLRTLVKTLRKIYLHKEMDNYKKKLEDRVLKQIKELEKKDEALMQQTKLATMGEIMDIVAHQWKQPLNVITLKSSFLEDLAEESESISLEKVKNCNKDVEAQVTHLIETLQEFRNFFRPNLNINNCSVSKIFKSLELLLRDDLLENKIHISFKDCSDITIRANENEIKHLLINIINNSKDAFLLNKIDNREILLDVSSSENEIVISVIDNAGGIPEDIIEHIFDLNYTTKDNLGGTGIGLYMSKIIANKYGAELIVKNLGNGVSSSLIFKK